MKKNQSNKFIVCGTDTDCGKSTAVIFLYHYLKTHCDTRPLLVKPVQTGTETDTDFYKQCQIRLDNIANFYTFKSETSPHLASLKEEMVIDTSLLENVSRLLIQRETKPIIFEMAGGIMAPLTMDYFMIDLMQALAIPVILVVSNQVGAINHLLMSVDILMRREIPIAGIIVNEKDPNGYSLSELKPFIKHRLIGTIPNLTDYTKTMKSNKLITALLTEWGLNDE